MTELTRQKIFEKFQSLDRYLLYLKKLGKEIKNKKEFLENFRLFGLAERYLQLSCQVIIDSLDLIVIEEGFKKPENRKEQISLLHSHKIISKNLIGKLEDIVKFRNILVHEYGEIDQKKVYENLFSKIKDFELFKKEILQWLQKDRD